MEHGNSFFHYAQSEKSISDSIPLQGEGINSGSKKQKEEVQVQQAEAKENQTVPIARVQKLIRKIVPTYAKVSDEYKFKIVECVIEFISFITGVANQRCQVEQRKTVTAEDLIYAMAKLGFDNYAELLTLYLHRYRQRRELGYDIRVPHRAGSLSTLPTTANINDALPQQTSFLGVFSSVIPPIVTNPTMGTMMGRDGSSSSANVYCDYPVAYFNRDNSFGN